MIFVYLARRDKRAVRLLAVAEGRLDAPARMDEAVQAGLDPAWQQAIGPHAEGSRQSCEVWLESAGSFAGLAASLRRRGYAVDPVQTPVAWVRSRPVPQRAGDTFCAGDKPASIDPAVLRRLDASSRRRRLGG